MKRATAIVIVASLASVAAAWTLIVLVPKWYAPKAASAPPAVATPPAPERKINATLYYLSDDGMSLVGVKREVAFGEPVTEQARRIVEAQLAPPDAPLASAVPAGTTLRALFLTDRGDAFVDVSRDISAKHNGGSLDELFTVYTIVNALTVNLPAISRVQILVDGKEVDTLAGHVDLRHPLQKSLEWIKE